MILGKGILYFSAAFWIGYGFFCMFWPETVSGFIGYQFGTPDTIIEVAAMYGGLEMGLGFSFLLCVRKPETIELGLKILLLTIGGLALTRMGAWMVIGGDVTYYTWGGIFYEGVSALVALVALIQMKKQAQG